MKKVPEQIIDLPQEEFNKWAESNISKEQAKERIKDIDNRINELAKKLSLEEKIKQSKIQDKQILEKQKREFKKGKKRINAIKEIKSSDEKEKQAEQLYNELRKI